MRYDNPGVEVEIVETEGGIQVSRNGGGLVDWIFVPFWERTDEVKEEARQFVQKRIQRRAALGPVTFVFPLETAPEGFVPFARYDEETGRNYGLPDVDYTFWQHEGEMVAQLRATGQLEGEESLGFLPGVPCTDEEGRPAAAYTFDALL